METSSPQDKEMEVGSPFQEDMEVGSSQEKDMEVGSSQEKDMEVNDKVCRMKDLNFGDNVQTPVALEKVNCGESFESMASLVNLKFKTEVEAFDFYNDYALKMGFAIRKDRSEKRKGVVISRTICCSKEGFKRKKPDGDVKRRRDSIRSGCTARILLKLEGGMYTIVRHVVEHNHECTPMKSYMFTSQRHISIAQAFEGGHALSVLYRANLEQGPNKYILRRLTKDAKQHIVKTSDLASKDKMTIPTRYKQLMRTSVTLSNMASNNQEAFEFVLDIMNDCLKKIKVISQCEPPNDKGAEPRREFNIPEMVDDGRIPCTNDNDISSIPSQVTAVAQKEKGLKGGKRKKSALEKVNTSGINPTKAKVSKDSTSTHQAAIAQMPTLSMNQQDQHLLFASATTQASSDLGMQPKMIESTKYALLPTTSKSDGFAPANIRMERPPWQP